MGGTKLKRELDGGILIFGLLLGLMIGGLVTLLTAPRSGRALRHELSESVAETGQSIRAALPSDPVAESLAEGKAAARRRLAEMGTP